MAALPALALCQIMPLGRGMVRRLPTKETGLKKKLIALALAFVCGSAYGQTFTGVAFDDEMEYFLLNPVDGQYDFTLTWDQDGLDIMGIFLSCGEDSYGSSVGFRDSASRLSIGLREGETCVFGIALLQGLVSNYTLNVSGTGSGFDVEKAASPAYEHVEAISSMSRAYSSEAFNRATQYALGKASARNTETFLEQIQAGRGKMFGFEAAKDGYVSITAMWNRADATLSMALVCQGENTHEVARSEGGQERFLRLDADLLTGFDCDLVVDTDKTAVAAINFAYLTKARSSRY